MPLTLYKASAGSGKTYTLALRWLQLALQYPDAWQHILAITFTKKATAEIKTRLLRVVTLVAYHQEPDRLARLLDRPAAEAESLRKEAESLIRKLEIPPQAPGETLADPGRRLLHALLHRYHRLGVSTIDSLFQRIVYAYERELGLPLGREVLIELDLLGEQLADELLRQLLPATPLHGRLLRYALHRLEEKKNWELRHQLLALIMRQLDSKAVPYLEQVLPHAAQLPTYVQANEARLAQLEGQLQALGQQGLARLQAHGLEVSHFSYGKSGAAQWFHRLAQQPLQLDGHEGRERLKQAVACGTAEGFYAKQQTNEIRQRIEAALEDGLYDLFAQMLALLEGHVLREYLTRKHLQKELYELQLQVDIAEFWKAYKAQAGIQLLGDAEQQIARIHAESDLPILYERLGDRYRHILLDEFQDTSEQQWANLLPLADEALGNHGVVVVVGDVKQSIYRFRGGAPQLLQQQLGQDLVAYAPQTISLNDNYRSARAIVQVNNALCRHIPQCTYSKAAPAITQQLLSAIYGNDAAQTAKLDRAGYVHWKFYPLKEGEKQDKKEAKGERKEQIEADFLKQIQALLAAGWRGSDLLILVSKNKEASAVVELLHTAGIPVFTPDALLLQHGAQVRLLHALLAYTHTPAAVHLAEALTAQAALLSQAPDPALLAAPVAAQLVGLSPGLPALLAANLPPYTLAMRLCALFETLDPQQDAYLQQYLQLLHSQLGLHGQLAHFLHYYDTEGKHKNKLNLPARPEAVQVLTIHKAKGLEAPVVLLPYANWDFFDKLSSQSSWVSLPPSYGIPFAIPVEAQTKIEHTDLAAAYEEETLATLLDQLNKLYVATTRAGQRLYAWIELPQAAEKKGKKQKEQEQAKEQTISSSGALLDLLSRQEPLAQGRSEHEFVWGTAEAPQRAEAPGVPEHPQPYPIAGKQLMPLQQPTAGANTEARQLGDDLHAELARLASLPTSAVSAPARALWAQLWQHPALQPYTSWRRLPEQCLGYQGQLLRPDLLCQQGTQLVLIDYKSGQPDAAHSLQVATYRAALQAGGRQVVDAFLVYLDVGQARVTAVQAVPAAQG
ncbi:MAG: UvrD-helicase domain-containing protein [Bacteroidetes bacterium]|nr:UvrD-helicase domain-containing protein [Bacteroidota bacterium]